MTESKYETASDEQLAKEAEQWPSGDIEPSEWIDAPEAVPKQGAATPISIRVPTRMLDIMKAFAKREGIGYQVLMKRWLDDQNKRGTGEAFRIYGRGSRAPRLSLERNQISLTTVSPRRA